jgi:hypothetical protein
MMTTSPADAAAATGQPGGGSAGHGDGGPVTVSDAGIGAGAPDLDPTMSPPSPDANFDLGPAADAPRSPPAPDPGAPTVVTFSGWPGTTPVVAVDVADQLGSNISGLAYLSAAAGQPAALLAVQNSPSRLHRFVEQGAVWVRDPNGWTEGRTLRFANGEGGPDAEGMTLAGAPGVAYVASEGGPASDPNRQTVLRYDYATPDLALKPTHEWNLTADLPPVDNNLGLEAIAWVPDAYLVARGFLDESTGQAYQPAAYAGHGSGLFFVGLELNATIYAFALDHQSGGAHRIATIRSGQLGVMDMSFDPDLGVLWAECDDFCGNRVTLLAVETDPSSPMHGRFVIKHGFTRPITLPKTNTEGITFAPVAECSPAGQRRFFWSDDAALEGHALRMGSIGCGPLY